MNTPYQQGPVSETVWPWVCPKNTAQAAKKKPVLKNSIALLVGLSVSGLFYWFDFPIMAAVVFLISASIFFCSLFFPKCSKAIERFLAWLSRTVGEALTWGLLVPFFYIWFTGAHVLLSLRGKDPMTRKLDYEKESYWQDKSAGDDLARYRRQF